MARVRWIVTTPADVHHGLFTTAREAQGWIVSTPDIPAESRVHKLPAWVDERKIRHSGTLITWDGQESAFSVDKIGNLWVLMDPSGRPATNRGERMTFTREREARDTARVCNDLLNRQRTTAERMGLYRYVSTFGR